MTEGFLTGKPVQPLSESASFANASPDVKAHVDGVQAQVHETLRAAIDWRAEADEHERQEERGYQFPMPYTFKQPARVRRIPLADLASITGLSSEMQTTVLEVFREIQSGGTFAVRQWQDLKRNQDRQKQLANGLCIAGFMEPRLVETHEEAVAANDPMVVWVEKIDIRDRLTYLQSVMNPESEAAKAMAPFPENGASDSQPSEGVQIATEALRLIEDAESVQPVGVPSVRPGLR